MHERLACLLPAPAFFTPRLVTRGQRCRAHPVTTADRPLREPDGDPARDDVPLLRALHERGARQRQVIMLCSSEEEINPSNCRFYVAWDSARLLIITLMP